ncbi:hypothetical protein Tco_0913551 [Tanacetum coccineum]
MLPVTQIDTFYNGLTLRHRDTINVATRETFMKRQPEECYDLMENMTAHHNDWDTSAHRGESTGSTTSSSVEIAALAQQMIEMRKDMLQIGYTQDIYVATGNYNSGGEVEKEPETLMDEVHITSPASTAYVPPLGIQPVSPPKPKEEPKISYPSRLNKTKLLDKNDVPEKLEDPEKFLIPCILQDLEICNSLADSGASINLMPLSIYEKLGIGPLKPT